MPLRASITRAYQIRHHLIWSLRPRRRADGGRAPGQTPICAWLIRRMILIHYASSRQYRAEQAHHSRIAAGTLQRGRDYAGAAQARPRRHPRGQAAPANRPRRSQYCAAGKYSRLPACLRHRPHLLQFRSSMKILHLGPIAIRYRRAYWRDAAWHAVPAGADVGAVPDSETRGI